MTANKPDRRLIERIRQASTELEIRDLLTEGSHYEGAADGTRKRWQKVAARRRKELAQ